MKDLQKIDSKTKKLIESRLKEFQDFKNKKNKDWFSELCFCILAANSKQKTAQIIQEKLDSKLLTMSQKNLAEFIRTNKHRFHNNKSKYIVEARNFRNIKDILSKEENKRDFLVKNIKGLGFKEASHFLRNTGTTDLAILDRHIINYLSENKIIEKPKSLTPKLYLEIETKFQNLAKTLNVTPAKLDLILWFKKTGEVAK